MNNLIKLSDNIPLRYSYLFRLNTLNILSLMEATPEDRVKASHPLPEHAKGICRHKMR